MRSASLAIALSLVLIPLSAAAETPRADDSALLEKLRNDSFDTRQDAREKLIARGLAVRPLIETELAKKDLDPDYRAGLKIVAAGLRELDAVLPFDAPRRIDLELKDETVTSALEKLSAYFGQNVSAKNNAGIKHVSLSIKGATFIEAVNAVRRAADLDFAPNYTIVPGSFGLSSVRIQRSAEAASAVPIDLPGPDDKTLERYKNLMLAERFANESESTAVQGPFAIVLTRIESKALANQANNLQLAGNLYFSHDACFSRLKFAALKVVDGEKEYTLISPSPTPVYVQFNKILSGKPPDGASFMCAFLTMVRVQEPLPAGATWKLTLGVEVPVRTSTESVDLGEALYNATQSLQSGEVTVTSVGKSDGEWSAEFSLTGGAYLGNSEPRPTFSIMTESLPFAPRGLNLASMSFQDAEGKTIPFRTRKRNYSRENGLSAYKMDVRTDTKPRTMLLSRMTKAATREYEFTFPSVPVPLTKSEN